MNLRRRSYDSRVHPCAVPFPSAALGRAAAPRDAHPGSSVRISKVSTCSMFSCFSSRISMVSVGPMSLSSLVATVSMSTLEDR